MMDDVQFGLDGWLFLKGGRNDVIRSKKMRASYV